jgi:hypothetical protein
MASKDTNADTATVKVRILIPKPVLIGIEFLL